MTSIAFPSTADAGPGWRRWLATASLGAGLTLVLGACTFGAPGSLQTPEDVAQILNTTPYKNPTSSNRWTVYSDTRFNVQHGMTCTQADRAATKTTLGVRVSEEAAILPNHQATVFLNGWDTEYSGNDHHVTGLGTAIFNVTRLQNTLFWEAGGLISDKKGDDKFTWCYRYTVLMWKPSSGMGPWGDTTAFNRIEVGPLVSQVGQRLISVMDPMFSQGPVMGLPASFDTTAAPPAGKLLMGFALSYGNSDHHVFQLGFDYGRSVVAGQNIHWVSKAILQDKNGDDGTKGAAISTVLTGASVRQWQPTTVLRVDSPTVATPVSNEVNLARRSGTRFCGAVGGSLDKVQQYRIPNVPYRYAVPMLTGFNLGYICTDHHVQRAGAFIEDFHYERAANAGSGTLFYTVRTTFHDDQWSDANLTNVAVTVLGIEPTQPIGNAGGIGGGVVGR